MIDQILAIASPLTIAISVELCGRQKESGFLLGFLVQVINGALAISAGLWGLLLGPIIVGPVMFRWYWKWKKGRRQKPVGTINIAGTDIIESDLVPKDKIFMLEKPTFDTELFFNDPVLTQIGNKYFAVNPAILKRVRDIYGNGG